MPRNAAHLASACAGWFCMISADACWWRVRFTHRCVESLGDYITFWYTEHRRSVRYSVYHTLKFRPTNLVELRYYFPFPPYFIDSCRVWSFSDLVLFPRKIVQRKVSGTYEMSISNPLLVSKFTASMACCGLHKTSPLDLLTQSQFILSYFP